MKSIIKHWHLSVVLLAMSSAVEAFGDGIVIDGPSGRTVINNPNSGDRIVLPNGQVYEIQRGALGLQVQPASASAPASTPASSTSGLVTTGDDVCLQFLFEGGSKYRDCMEQKKRALQTVLAQFPAAANTDHPCRDGLQPGAERQKCAAVWLALRQQVVQTVANSVQCYTVPSYDTNGNRIDYQACTSTPQADPWTAFYYGSGATSASSIPTGVAANFRSFISGL